MLAELLDAMVGVDTHRDTLQAEIALPTGAPIAIIEVGNDSAGYERLQVWAAEHAPGPRVAFCVEGTRSYGLGLTRALTAAGTMVLECEQPTRKRRRGRGKSDLIDAHLAVLFGLSLPADRLPTPRADGDREALRILLSARAEMTMIHTAQINRLRDLLRGGDDHERALARRKELGKALLSGLADRPVPPGASRAEQVRHAEISRLAAAIINGNRELAANEKTIDRIVNDLVPGLTAPIGIGPITGARAIVAYSHPGRCRNEAAYASLAGTAPLEASSGLTTRHRLNRGGDRDLNSAIHTIANTRMRYCPRTTAYVTRRTGQGKPVAEVRRCLKRYIARELYRTLTTAMTPACAA